MLECLLNTTKEIPTPSWEEVGSPVLFYYQVRITWCVCVSTGLKRLSIYLSYTHVLTATQELLLMQTHLSHTPPNHPFCFPQGSKQTLIRYNTFP